MEREGQSLIDNADSLGQGLDGLFKVSLSLSLSLRHRVVSRQWP